MWNTNLHLLIQVFSSYLSSSFKYLICWWWHPSKCNGILSTWKTSYHFQRSKQPSCHKELFWFSRFTKTLLNEVVMWDVSKMAIERDLPKRWMHWDFISLALVLCRVDSFPREGLLPFFFCSSAPTWSLNWTDYCSID